jgi:hypothetical protein
VIFLGVISAVWINFTAGKRISTAHLTDVGREMQPARFATRKRERDNAS